MKISTFRCLLIIILILQTAMGPVIYEWYLKLTNLKENISLILLMSILGFINLMILFASYIAGNDSDFKKIFNLK